MKELSDKEFDRLFKEKSTSHDFEFEETSWALMEQKLRKRNRIVYIRNFSMAALILLFLGFGLYFLPSNLQNSVKGPTYTHHVPTGVKSSSLPSTNKQVNKNSDDNVVERNDIALNDHPTTAQMLTRIHSKTVRPRQFASIENKPGATALSATKDSMPYQEMLRVQIAHLRTDSVLISNKKDISVAEVSTVKQKGLKLKPTFGLSFALGPDVSAVQAVKLNQSRIAMGLMFDASIKRLAIRTGVRYGLKKYDVSAYDYTLRNPARAPLIDNIDASCNVLELPLELSYRAFKFNKQELSFNAGLSSYLMLKEKYIYRYTAASGIGDFTTQLNNENKAYFSVLSLSSTFLFNPISKHLQLGIEPYVKIPMGGVGAGKVKLKSGGIALTSRFSLYKRH